MSADEIKVGDRVRPLHRGPAESGTVLALYPEGDAAWVLWDGCPPYSWDIAELAKAKEPTPLPECWCNVSLRGLGGAYRSRSAADETADSGRIGVLHVRPDGSTEFHRTEEL